MTRRDLLRYACWIGLTPESSRVPSVITLDLERRVNTQEIRLISGGADRVIPVVEILRTLREPVPVMAVLRMVPQLQSIRDGQRLLDLAESLTFRDFR